MLTPAQIKVLERARDTLLAIQRKLEDDPSRDYDDGRLTQACTNAELAIFEVINLNDALHIVDAVMSSVRVDDPA